MTLLVITPDYASHLLPLATIGTAWRDAGQRVVVATGPSTAAIVEQFGFERVDLELGRGSNPGVIRADQQKAAAEQNSLRGFFDATRLGMVEALSYQAHERLTDLMWQPVQKARAVLEIVDRVRPDAIVVDHLAFSARLGLQTAGVPYFDVVLGHPSALPIGDEVYGYPPVWPAAFDPDTEALAALHDLCRRVSERFTDEWNRAARELDPAVAPVRDAFAAHGPRVLYNYPRALADPQRLAPDAVFLGSTVRTEPADPEVDAWLTTAPPFVYVSFGSFLSARADVLQRVVAAIAELGMTAAIATGSADPDELGAMPPDWLVREFLPQVRLLERAAVAVTHGGNNSVTEGLTAGVPLVLLPFSTDQFAGAAALESAGLGIALDPNAAAVSELADAIGRLAGHDPSAGPRAELAAELRQTPGPELAFTASASADTSSAIASTSDEATR